MNTAKRQFKFNYVLCAISLVIGVAGTQTVNAQTSTTPATKSSSLLITPDMKPTPLKKVEKKNVAKGGTNWVADLYANAPDVYSQGMRLNVADIYKMLNAKGADVESPEVKRLIELNGGSFLVGNQAELDRLIKALQGENATVPDIRDLTNRIKENQRQVGLHNSKAGPGQMISSAVSDNQVWNSLKPPGVVVASESNPNGWVGGVNPEFRNSIVAGEAWRLAAEAQAKRDTYTNEAQRQRVMEKFREDRELLKQRYGLTEEQLVGILKEQHALNPMGFADAQAKARGESVPTRQMLPVPSFSAKEQSVMSEVLRLGAIADINRNNATTEAERRSIMAQYNKDRDALLAKNGISFSRLDQMFKENSQVNPNAFDLAKLQVIASGQAVPKTGTVSGTGGTSVAGGGSGTTTTVKPRPTQAEIKAFVQANISDPAKMRKTMLENGLTYAEVARASGYTLDQVRSTLKPTDAEIKAYVQANPSNLENLRIQMLGNGLTYGEVARATGYSLDQVRTALKPTDAEIKAYVESNPSNMQHLREQMLGNGLSYTDVARATGYSLDQVRTALKPTDNEIKTFVQANINDPKAISTAMRDNGLAIADVARATGFSEVQVRSFLASGTSTTSTGTGTSTTTKPVTTVTKPTDSQIKSFVQANINNPQAISTAMRDNGLSIADVARATGFSEVEVRSYLASGTSSTTNTATTSTTTTRTGTTSVTNTSGTTVAAPAPAASKPSDTEIKTFVQSNMSNPAAIASAMRANGLSYADVARATGYTEAQVKSFLGSY